MKNCMLLTLICVPSLSWTPDLLDFSMTIKISFVEMEEVKLVCFQMRCDTALNYISQLPRFIHDPVKFRNHSCILCSTAAAESSQIYEKTLVGRKNKMTSRINSDGSVAKCSTAQTKEELNLSSRNVTSCTDCEAFSLKR